MVGTFDTISDTIFEMIFDTISDTIFDTRYLDMEGFFGIASSNGCTLVTGLKIYFCCCCNGIRVSRKFQDDGGGCHGWDEKI